MPLKECSVDLRWIRNKRKAIRQIYDAIGFEGEAGTNLDALHDVLSAWGTPVRVTFKKWDRFAARVPETAEGISAVLNDVMMENRNIIFAFKPED